MRVRKRDGDTEPVDVNKIVKAVERWVADLDEVDPLRVATKTISGLYDGASTAELDRLSIQTAAELIGEEPQYSKLAARLLAAYVDKEVRGQQVASFSQSIRYAHGLGLIGDATAAFVAANAREAGRRDRPGRRPAVRVLRAADRRGPVPAAASADPAGGGDAAALAAAGRVRTVADAGRGDRLLPADVQPGVPAEFADAVQLRHPAHPDVVVLPGRLAARRTRLDLRALPPGREAVEVLRRHRHLLVPGARPGRADPGHQRPLQRHRAVPQDAGRRGGSGQPGRPAQGRGLRLPGALAPGHRGVPRAAGQHRRGGPAYAQPEPGQLDPGRVHAAGRGRRRLVAGRPVRRARTARPVRRGLRRGVPRGGEEGRPDGQGPRPVRADDAYARPDRQRVDDVQGRGEPAVQPDRRAGQHDPPVEPVHRDPGGQQRHRDRGLQPRVDQPGCARHRRRRRLGEAALDRTHRRGVPRPGDRHQPLPGRAGGGLQPALAPRRARADGPPGRVLHAAPAVRLGVGRGSCRPGCRRRSS